MAMNTLHIGNNFPHGDAFSFAQHWEKQGRAHIETANATFQLLENACYQWADQGASVLRAGNKIMFCGNGGSAADANHIAAELSIKLKADRRALAGISLTMDASQMTACGNDYGFDHIYARQVEALGKPGDMLVGLTTSGNSPNILKAMETARGHGIYTVGLTGGTGGKMANERLADILISVPDTVDTARIQEMHITLGHIFVGAVERMLGLINE